MPPPLTRSKSPAVIQQNQRNVTESTENIVIYDSESDGDDITDITVTSPKNIEISSKIIFYFNLIIFYKLLF